MELRRNITFSVVLHLLIIAAAFSLNGRETAYRFPMHSMMALLCEEIADSTALSSQKIAHFNPVKKKVTEEDIIHQKHSPDRTAEVSAPVQRDEAKKDTPANSEAMHPRLTTGSGESSPAQTTDKSRTGDSSMQLAEIPSGQNGAHSAYALIRAAIERAKTYPLPARKKKYQGTVLTAFTIGNGGHPVNITIEKSSGYEILDSEAAQTVRRAAPFPQVSGKISIPITYKLAESTSLD